MKNRIVLVLCLIFLLALSGCGAHEHTWIEASCTEPRTCSECGETEGEPLGHSWAEATCEKAATCTVCGETDGAPLGHSWTEYPTVDAPVTCTVCGETQGNAVSMYCPVEAIKKGDTYTLVTYDEAGNELCSIPDVTDFDLAEANDGTLRIIADVHTGEFFSIIIYDLNGKELTRYDGLSVYRVVTLKDGNTLIFPWVLNDDKKSYLLSCYGLEGEKKYQIDNLVDFDYFFDSITKEEKLVALCKENNYFIPIVYDIYGSKSYEFPPADYCSIISSRKYGTILAQVFNKDDYSFRVVVSDLQGNEIFSTEWVEMKGWSWFFKDDFFMSAYGIDGGEFVVRLYDYSGTILKDATYPISRYGYPDMGEADEHGVARIYDSKTDKTLFYVDAYSGQEVPAEQAEDGSYVSDTWSSFNPSPIPDRIGVATPDKTRWGFIDEDGKELAMYADASNFNRYGYALASNDRENYFVIDKDFHVISGEYPGIGAAALLDRRSLRLEIEEGDYKFFIIR